jgi:cell division protein FtsB
VRRRSSGRTLVLAGAVLAVALMLAVPVRSWLSQRADVDRLDAEIAQAQSRVDALAAQKQRWEDPRYVSAQARLRLNMVKPGQSALIALDREDEREAEIEQAETSTWYEKLWDTTRSVAAPDQQTVPDGDGG